VKATAQHVLDGLIIYDNEPVQAQRLCRLRENRVQGWQHAQALRTPHVQALARYASQDPDAVLLLSTESAARALDAHILPVQVYMNDV